MHRKYWILFSDGIIRSVGMQGCLVLLEAVPVGVFGVKQVIFPFTALVVFAPFPDPHSHQNICPANRKGVQSIFACLIPVCRAGGLP